MKRTITTTLTGDELMGLISEAVKEAMSNITGGKIDNTEEEVFLSQREAAEFLRVTLATLIRWKNERKIPYYQQGRKVLFKKSEILNSFKKNKSA